MSLSQAIQLLRRGNYTEGIPLLEQLRVEQPDDANLLWNLGAAYTEVGQVDRAIDTLQAAIAIAPNLVDAHTALGYAYSHVGRDEEAAAAFRTALEIEPANPTALKNLGAILARMEKYDEAAPMMERALERSPNAPEIAYGLGVVYEQLGDVDNAVGAYRKVLAIRGESEFRYHAQEALTRIAEKTMRTASEVRPDVMMYCQAALDLFEPMDRAKVRDIVVDIGLTGQRGFDINTPSKKYRVKSLDGEYTGLQLVSYMYTGLRVLGMNADVGLDLSREYELAAKLRGGGGKSPFLT